VRLTGTLMNLCLCLAWMQTVHIESSCVYQTIRDFMVVGFIWASRRCHILDCEIMSDFQVDLVLAVIGALDDSIVGSIVGSIVRSAIVGSIVGFPIIGSIVGSAIVGFAIVSLIVGSAIVGFGIVGLIVGSAIVGSIVGSAISTRVLSLFLFFPFSVVDMSAVAGTMI